MFGLSSVAEISDLTFVQGPALILTQAVAVSAESWDLGAYLRALLNMPVAKALLDDLDLTKLPDFGRVEQIHEMVT